ncbi:MAG: hypothetical protein Q9208_002810 [Pyrenodesmia sp. 3 TL-2023]
MTTALPTFLGDPSLPTPNNPSHSPNPNPDLEAATTTKHPNNNNNNPTLSTAPSTNPRSSLSSSGHAPSIPWGPSHPCYPHPNPHLPLSSPLLPRTRIIRIPRDWTTYGDLAPQYSNTYPEILEPWVSEQDFRLLISRINSGLAEAFGISGTEKDGGGRLGGWGVWKDALLGLATGWLWEDFGGAGVKGGCRRVEGLIEEWNREKGREGEGVRCWGLRRTGYLSLDLQIPDPHVRIVGSREDGVNGDREEGLGQGVETETVTSTVKEEGD